MKDQNAYYLNNESLPTAKTEFEWTPEMVTGLAKAQKDIIYFAENFFYIVNLDRGKEIISLFKFQKRVLKTLSKHNRVVLLASRQSGKALALDTLIPTPLGYRKMGDLKTGDQVYDENGKICNITKAHDVLYNRNCYKITFDTNEEIIADSDHLWFTQTKQERLQNKIGSIKTTETIANTLLRCNKEPNHRILKSKALEGTPQDLLIDPYLLGVWLGDGHSAGSRISIGKQDIVEMSQLLNQPYFTIKSDSHTNFNYSINGKDKKRTTNCFLKNLRQLNLLNNKHIPKQYLLAPINMRLELLKGLMDTDGYIKKTGQCQITSSYPTLAKDIIELINSLGFHTSIKIKSFSNPNHRPSTIISFTPNIEVFKLKRKLERQYQHKPTPSYNRINYNYIKKMEKISSIPVRCITVDSPNNLYLCGKTHIVTHNTTMMSVFALWYICFNKDKNVLLVANKEKTAIEILGRVRTAYELLPNWLKPGVVDYSKTNMLLANGSRIFISTTASTAARGSSINCLILEECAHIDRYKEDEFFNSVMPVISSSKNSKVFLISTAKGTSNRFYKIYSEAELGKNEWKSEKIHWTEVPGRDEKWRRNALSDLGGDEQYFAQEYENVFIETGETAIDKDIIRSFRENVRTPEILNTNEYKVWEAPDSKKIYVMGIDVSDGVGNAASCIQGLDVTDLTSIKQVFKYWNKFIDTAHFAKEIFEISKQWGKPPILIERNSMGGEVVNFLTNQPYNYEKIVSYDQSQQVNYQKGGIYSSTNVKYEGVSNMRYWMNSLRAVEIYDLQTIQEIETFVKYPNGTWHKLAGLNVYDDCVMSLLWGLFALHTPIAETLFEISQYDERGKPLKIRKSSYDDDKEFYGLNQYRKNWGDEDFVPAFVGQKSSYDNQNPEMEDLMADGWQVLSKM